MKTTLLALIISTLTPSPFGGGIANGVHAQFTKKPSVSLPPTSSSTPTTQPSLAPTTLAPMTSAPSTPPTTPLQTIVEIAAGAEFLKTLVTALTVTGLDATLSTEGPFTVFAPTDSAFAALPEGTLDALLADPKSLADILLFHVLEGKVDSSMVMDIVPTEVPTVNGASLPIAIVGGEVILNGNAKIIAVDIMASNGIIHVIDAVLIPPSLPVTDPPTSPPVTDAPIIGPPTIFTPTTSGKSGKMGKKSKKAKFGKKDSKKKATKKNVSK